MHCFLMRFVLSLLALHAVSAHSCIEHERKALIEFKDGVIDPAGRLASWRGHKCCDWAGIRCSNKTGHVVRLDLRNSDLFNELSDIPGWVYNHTLTGEISPSLLALSELKYLDLSFNDFSENTFPEFVSSFRKLEYLNLSYAGLSGIIPAHLGNLTTLQYLDLSYNDLWTGTGYDVLMADADVRWLSHLTSLKHLYMSHVDLQNSINWVQSLNKLPSLEKLVLDRNNLHQIPQSLPSTNFTSLRVLQLTDQDFNTNIPDWIFSLHDLTSLDLGWSNFVGPFPHALGNLTSLNELILDYNLLVGSIPPLHNLTKLSYLSMYYIFESEKNINITDIVNSISPDSARTMERLVLSRNNLIGILPGEWIREMSNLKYLDLSLNYLNG